MRTDRSKEDTCAFCGAQLIPLCITGTTFVRGTSREDKKKDKIRNKNETSSLVYTFNP